MSSADQEISEYLAALPAARRQPMTLLRAAVTENLPAGFQECFDGMPAYVVPLSRYPAGYHCKADTPLPFISFASQKNFIALYHFGMYGDAELQAWFREQYARRVNTKLDMGKSCVRFRKPEQMPLELIGELARQRSVEDWIACYERQMRR